MAHSHPKALQLAGFGCADNRALYPPHPRLCRTLVLPPIRPFACACQELALKVKGTRAAKVHQQALVNRALRAHMLGNQPAWSPGLPPTYSAAAPVAERSSADSVMSCLLDSIAEVAETSGYDEPTPAGPKSPTSVLSMGPAGSKLIPDSDSQKRTKGGLATFALDLEASACR